jgi:hypothetical protein
MVVQRPLVCPGAHRPMRKRLSRIASSAISLCFVVPVQAAPHGHPSLVPPGWTQEDEDAAIRTRRFVSPDKRSSLTSWQMDAKRTNVTANMKLLAAEDRITYRRQEASWFVLSGYRGDQIFYRKANVACHGTRWNLIELLYPRENEHQMDAAVAFISHGMTAYRDDCA